MNTRALLGVALAALSFGGAAYAQSTATVTLNATLAEKLILTATPANVNFTLNNGTTANGSAPVVITTQWLMLSTRSSVKLFGWFTTPTAALTDGLATPNNIPSSEVLGQVATGTPTSFTAFTQTNTVGTAGGGLLLYTQTLTALNRASSRTDNLALQIDLTSQPQLPAGTYTGTLNLQAQAF